MTFTSRSCKKICRPARACEIPKIHPVEEMFFRTPHISKIDMFSHLHNTSEHIDYQYVYCIFIIKLFPAGIRIILMKTAKDSSNLVFRAKQNPGSLAARILTNRKNSFLFIPL